MCVVVAAAVGVLCAVVCRALLAARRLASQSVGRVRVASDRWRFCAKFRKVLFCGRLSVSCVLSRVSHTLRHARFAATRRRLGESHCRGHESDARSQGLAAVCRALSLRPRQEQVHSLALPRRYERAALCLCIQTYMHAIWCDSQYFAHANEQRKRFVSSSTRSIESTTKACTR